MLIVDPSSTCGLCEEQYTLDALPHCIPCGHVCCAACLLKINHPPRCPFCREYFSQVSIRKFYVNFKDESTAVIKRRHRSVDKRGRASPTDKRGPISPLLRSKSPIDVITPLEDESRIDSRPIEEKLARAILRGQPGEILEVNKEAQNWIIQTDKRKPNQEDRKGAVDQHAILRSLSYLTYCQLNSHVRVLEADQQSRTTESHPTNGLSGTEEALKKEKRRLQLKELECEDLRNDCLRLQSELDMSQRKASTSATEWDRERAELLSLLDHSLMNAERAREGVDANSQRASTQDEEISRVEPQHPSTQHEEDNRTDTPTSDASGLLHESLNSLAIVPHTPAEPVVPDEIVNQAPSLSPSEPPADEVPGLPELPEIVSSENRRNRHQLPPLSIPSPIVEGPPPIPFSSRPISPSPLREMRASARTRERSISFVRERSKSRPRERLLSLSRHRPPLSASPVGLIQERRGSTARERPRSPLRMTPDEAAAILRGPDSRVLSFVHGSAPSMSFNGRSAIDPATLHDSDSTSTDLPKRSMSISAGKVKSVETSSDKHGVVKRALSPTKRSPSASPVDHDSRESSPIKPSAVGRASLSRRASEGTPVVMTSNANFTTQPLAPASHSSTVSGQPTTRIYFNDQPLTHHVARRFLQYYSTNIGGAPDLTISVNSSERHGSWWQAVMTVTSRARRIGFGCGHSQEVAENNCYIDAAHYVESIFPALWKTFVECEREERRKEEEERKSKKVKEEEEAARRRVEALRLAKKEVGVSGSSDLNDSNWAHRRGNHSAPLPPQQQQWSAMMNHLRYTSSTLPADILTSRLRGLDVIDGSQAPHNRALPSRA